MRAVCCGRAGGKERDGGEWEGENGGDDEKGKKEECKIGTGGPYINVSDTSDFCTMTGWQRPCPGMMGSDEAGLAMLTYDHSPLPS